MNEKKRSISTFPVCCHIVHFKFTGWVYIQNLLVIVKFLFNNNPVYSIVII